MKVIKRNAIRCLKCGDVIESKSVHDFQQCSCGATFVDGGHEYIRIGGNQEDWESLVEYEEKPGHIVTIYMRYGGVNKIETTRDINELIKAYEDMWAYLEIKDESGNLVYKTRGLENFIAKL